MDDPGRDEGGEPGGPGGGAGDDPERGQPDTGAIGAELAKLRREHDELNTKLLRTVADYQNSMRRSVKDSEEARHQGAKSVVLNVLTVLDHFDLALSQNPDKATVEQIISGVKVIRDELMRVLETHGVSPINPQPDDEFDPNRHQAVAQQDAEGIGAGRIVTTLKPGYALGDRIVRPAVVTVKPRGE